LIFPAEVRQGQINTFLRVVDSFGGVADIAQVSKELDTDLTQLLPILDAAELLGLVTVEKGDVKLTETGRHFLSLKRGRSSLVREALSKVEPFATVLTLDGKFRAKDLADELSRKNIRWHHEDEVNTSILNEILINWGIASGILEYDGSDSTFSLKKPS
jgi:hypothetical protein